MLGGVWVVFGGRHPHKAPPHLDRNIIKTGIFVFMRCWNYNVSFVSEINVNL